MDPEKMIHNPNLYAIWNLKAFIMDEIANLYNPFNSNFFIYVDAGSFREKTYQNWPNLNFIKNLKSQLRNKILFGLIKSFNDINYSAEGDYIQGTFFAG